MSKDIANQLFLAYLGRPADTAWRNATATLLNSNAPPAQLQNAFYSAAVVDGTFSLTDSTSQLVNKIFLNIFGFGASTAEQAAWAALISNGAMTVQTAAWTIFSSYLGATNLGALADTYQVPARSKLIAVEAYTQELLNNPAANLALSSGAPTVTLAAKTFISGINTAANAAAATTATAISTTVSGVTNAQTGTSFNLTSGVDNLIGTSSNDTFTADNTGTPKQLSVADTINGGAGTDTLRIFLNTGDTGTGQPTLTSIETVYINGGAVGTVAATPYVAAAGTTALQIDSPVVNSAATINVSGQSVALLNHAVTNAVTTTVDYGSTAATGALSLTGQTKGTGGTNTIDLKGAALATLALTSATTANNITLTNTGGALKTINIDGGANLTLATSVALNGVDASKATGNVALDTSAGTTAAAFAFTGGAGNDTLTVTSASLTALTAGTQLNGGAGSNDKIGISTATVTFAASDYTKLNAATGFEVLGLSSSTESTVDASQLTSIKSFAVDAASSGTYTINNLQAGSTVSLNAAANAVTLAPAIGVNSVAINIAATSAGLTVPTVTTTGLSTLTIATTGTAGAATITNLVNSDNSSITITGARAFTTTLNAAATTGSSVDGSAATGTLTLTGSNANDVIKGGTAVDSITGGQGADKLTGGAGGDTFIYNGTAGSNQTGITAGDEITDFVVGTDKLQITNQTEVASLEQTAVQAAVTALAATATAAQIAAAMAGANATNLGVSFAVFGGSTYVYFEAAGGGAVAANDIFIKLTGVTTLPTLADFTA